MPWWQQVFTYLDFQEESKNLCRDAVNREMEVCPLWRKIQFRSSSAFGCFCCHPRKVPFVLWISLLWSCWRLTSRKVHVVLLTELSAGLGALYPEGFNWGSASLCINVPVLLLRPELIYLHGILLCWVNIPVQSVTKAEVAGASLYGVEMLVL